MSNENTTKRTPRPAKHNWDRLDLMTAAQRKSAAKGDADARPLAPRELMRLKRTPQVKIIRRALKLSQEEFSARFQIPLGTLRDWKQSRKDPDAAARAYLRVIARNPEAVSDALQSVLSSRRGA